MRGEVVKIPRDYTAGFNKGTYRPITFDGVTTAKLVCPECGLVGDLDHDIDAQGIVTPSVDCPGEDCNFHEMIQLIGWTP